MLYVDLAELPGLFDRFWLWSARSPAPAWFRRADHHGNAEVPLEQSIRDLVAARTGSRPEGPVRLLTHFRYFGYCFNPLSIFYCYSREGELEAVVLEVSNTPWGEMHTYVLTRGTPIANGGFRFDFPKSFHVSPFLPMDMEYRCRLAPPGPRLAFALENWRQGVRCFDAHLNFRREAISSRSLARVLASDPLATLRVTALIYWQAWQLWRKRAPVYDHAPAGTVPGDKGQTAT
jgi:DUF1365 family protein